jgi:hypothetical protein
MPRTARLSNRARRRLCAACTAWMRWSAARPIQLAGTVSQTTIAVSAANQPRVKHRLFRIWIKRSREGNVTTRLPRGRCEAVARQGLEAAFGLRQRFQIFRVKMMTGIACVIHDDLRSHRRISTIGFLFQPGVTVIEIRHDACSKMRHPASCRGTVLGAEKKAVAPLPPRRQARRALEHSSPLSAVEKLTCSRTGIRPDHLLNPRGIIEPEENSCGGAYVPARCSSPERPLLGAKQTFGKRWRLLRAAFEHRATSLLAWYLLALKLGETLIYPGSSPGGPIH